MIEALDGISEELFDLFYVVGRTYDGDAVSQLKDERALRNEVNTSTFYASEGDVKGATEIEVAKAFAVADCM